MSKVVNKYLLWAASAMLTLFFIAGCAPQEQYVLGIPKNVWNQLTPAERQQVEVAYQQRQKKKHHKKRHSGSK